MARATVTTEVFAAAYKAARQVLEGEAKLTDAQKTLAAKFGIADRTASGYIGCFLAMRRGRTFKTIVSADGLRFMLDRIAEGGPGDLMDTTEGCKKNEERKVTETICKVRCV